MEIWIAIIGGVLGLFSIALSNYFSKRSSLNFEKMKLKEEYYKLYIESLSNNVNNLDRDKALQESAFAENRLKLVASAEVLIKLNDFRKTTRLDSGFSKSNIEHDLAITELVKAMRRDLYGKKFNKNFPNIGIIGRTKNPNQDNLNSVDR